MPLLTDPLVVTIDDLTKHDSSLLEVSAVEGINLTAKLLIAQEEVELEILALLDRERTHYCSLTQVAPLSLHNVVVTPPIRLWQTYEALAQVYRDGYFGQLNDRYKAKWDEYRSMAKWAKNKLLETGLGLVTNPIAQAEVPFLSETAATESGGTFYFCVSFVNLAGEEGASSPIASITTADGMAPDVLTGNAPSGATGWNLYAGTSPDSIFLQNASPLDLGSDSVFFPSSMVQAGATPESGQKPNVFRALHRLLQRG